MVRAELYPGEEASGKLVAMVREMARDLAAEKKLDLILIDGSPGIGCPVIASLTGVDLALGVTEHTVTAEHDLVQLMDVAGHFGIKTAVCINRAQAVVEIGGSVAEAIEEMWQGLEGTDLGFLQALYMANMKANFLFLKMKVIWGF